MIEDWPSNECIQQGHHLLHLQCWGSGLMSKENPRMPVLLGRLLCFHYNNGTCALYASEPWVHLDCDARLSAARCPRVVLPNPQSGQSGVNAGFRPTSGCYDAGDGIVPLVPSRDTPGMMARTVEDIILMNSVLSTCNTTIPAIGLEGLRVGFATNWWSQVADEVSL